MDLSLFLTYGLAIFAVTSIALVALPYLTGEIKAEKRRELMQAPRRQRGERTVDVAQRRKQIADSLKEIEQRGKSKKLSLEVKLQQAGLEWGRRGFVIACIVAGGVVGVLAYLIEDSLLIGGAAAGVGAFGIPLWIVGFMRKRRMQKFVDNFPNAVDVIIRGVKTGLPLPDCLRMIAAEAPEPIKTEFRRVVEEQQLGLTVSEAVERMVERVPVPESNFFAIVIGIQQKSGGNLSEALTNLAKVIRDRKKMKAKAKAMASEARTSAMIIGSLPFAVGFLVYLTTPAYMEALWTTTTGRVVCGLCLVWMSVGIFVMRKMINFDV